MKSHPTFDTLDLPELYDAELDALNASPTSSIPCIVLSCRAMSPARHVAGTPAIRWEACGHSALLPDDAFLGQPRP
jgi:hypothetical protein